MISIKKKKWGQKYENKCLISICLEFRFINMFVDVVPCTLTQQSDRNIYVASMKPPLSSDIPEI